MKHSIITFFVLLLAILCRAQDHKLGVTQSGTPITNRRPGNIYPVTKLLSKDYRVSPSSNIIIKSKFRDYEIRIWEQNTLKIETKVTYDSLKAFSQNDLWKKAKVEVTYDSDNVNISATSTDALTIRSQSKVKLDSEGKLSKVTAEPVNNRNLIVFIPRGLKVKIQDEYANVLVSGSLTEFDANLFNCVLEVEEIEKLSLVSKYSNVSIGNTAVANILFEQGMLTGNNVRNLITNSKTSIIEFGDVDSASINSNNDTYEMRSVRALTGQKKLGSIRIENMLDQFDLDGENVDIRFTNIQAKAQKIRIKDQYATLYLPLTNRKNYTLAFSGNSTSFMTTIQELKQQLSASKYTGTGGGQPAENGLKGKVIQLKYKQGNGAGTDINISCSFCSINTK